MLNHIWAWMIFISIIIAGVNDVYHEVNRSATPAVQNVQSQDQNSENKAVAGENTVSQTAQKPKKQIRNLNKETKLGQITTAAINAADVAVKISFGLIGVMALWLGVMRVAEKAGMIGIISRLVRPITKRLFPTIPEDHPAIGAMIMNIAANMLGLNNAATPLGLKAMEELDKLNPKKGVATDDMITFLVINTSAITLVPATAIAIRASLGSANPQKIVVPSIIAASMATLVGITTVKLIQWYQKKKGKMIDD